MGDRWIDQSSTIGSSSVNSNDSWYEWTATANVPGQLGAWRTGSGAGVGGVIDSAFGTLKRHTDMTPEQWRDPSRTTLVWPDPPLAQRSWSFDAWLGVHALDKVDVKSYYHGSLWNKDPGDFTYDIGQTAVTEDTDTTHGWNWGPPDSYTIDGTETDAKSAPKNPPAGTVIGYKEAQVPGVPDYAYELTGLGFLRHEITGSIRHIYEPHFVSTPFKEGVTFLREGIDTQRLKYNDGESRVYHSEIKASENEYCRLIYTNERAEKRDFGVSQTQKVPTGGIGGNPFWLKDTKDWPDILKSLHFDFMPFMVPKAKTRPVNYRFWDSMYATALFGGPTFAIVLDEYGIFDSEYYRMVIRHFTQSEQQITQWRSGIWGQYGLTDMVNDRSALCPRNYINPHAWYQAVQTGKVPNFHPFKDSKPGDFTGGSFSMEGWTGPCCELVLGLPPDVDPRDLLPDLPADTPKTPRYTDMDAMRAIYPYYDSKQELTMNNKRKLHQHNCHVAHPFAVQDYYFTFVLAAEANMAYGSGMDIFEYSKKYTPIEHLAPEMLTHMLSGNSSDVPFTLGSRFKDLLQLAGDANATTMLLGECFDNTVMNDPMIPKLHDPVVGIVQAYVVENLQKLQKWAIKEVTTIVKKQGAKITEKYVWPLVESIFPKLAPFIKENLKALGNALVTVDFTKPVSTWAPQLSKLVDKWFTGLQKAGYEYLKEWAQGDGKDMLMQSLYNKFRKRPDAGLTEEEMENWGVDDDGWRFPDSKFDTELSTVDDEMKAGFNELEKAPETWVAEGAEGAEDAIEAVEAGAEASMASIAGPLIVAVAVTLILDWWEKKEEDDAKKAQEFAQARATWAEYDTLRVPFSVSYLTGLGPRINKLAGYGSSGDTVADSLDVIQGLYSAGGNVNKDIIDQEIEDQVGQTADADGNYSASKGQRYLNLDPTLVDKKGKSVPCQGDLRTVANLIAMNHLCLRVISPSFFANSEDVTDAIRLRAQELLIAAEVIRTMRVVDHFMRAASWIQWGWSDSDRPDEKLWHPYPPVSNIPTSLIPAYMTPIPVLIPTKTDMDSQWYSALNPQKSPGTYKYKNNELLQMVEGTGYAAADWDAYVEKITDKYGACPKYEFNDATYIVQGVTNTVRHRSVPVPIFAPGRSPTMFVSSLDPTFAWPTLAVRGTPNMSAFIDESAYFETHNICYQPHPSSSDLMNIVDWRNAIKGVSCTPTFGGKSCRFILTVDTTPDIGIGGVMNYFNVVNESSSTVLVVKIDDTSASVLSTLKPGESGTALNNSDLHTAGYEYVYYIVSQELFAPENQLKDFTTDMQVSLPYAYRSYMFSTKIVSQGGKDIPDFSGTIVVYDHTLISTNISVFESRMRNLVVPIMNANPHCYEPLAEFYNTYYPKLTSVEFKKHDAVCKWLLNYILLPQKNALGTPVATPLDKNKQVNIWKLGRSIFHGDAETWTDLYDTTPVPDDLATFTQASCTDLGAAMHPKTYPEGGLRVHRLLSYTDDPESAAKTASYAYDAEYEAIQASLAQIQRDMEAIRVDPVKVWGSGDEFFDAIVSLVNDIINNNQDMYDAAQIVHKFYGESADALDALGAAERIRVNRISAILRLTADIDNTRAETAIEEYKQKTPEPSSFTRALEMMFTVRKNPDFYEVNNTYFSSYPAFHQLLMQMSKDCYSETKSNLVHPNTKQIAYYLTTGELASTDEASVYFMPQLTETAISGPTLFIAFRGTDPDKDLINKFGKPTGISLFQKIATFMNPYSDIMSDLHILLGTQAEAPRFDASDALVQLASQSYKMNLVLTGHSLGGSLAVHCLERNPNAVTMAVVFNPGKGLDGTYFDQVEANIANKMKPETYTIDTGVVPTTTIITDVPAEEDGQYDGQWDIPTTFSADADFKTRGIKGTVVPGSTSINYSGSGPAPMVQYQYIGVSTTFSADADLKTRGIIGTVVPGSTRLDDRTQHILYDYTAIKSTANTIETNVLAVWVPNAVDGEWDVPTTFSADADFKTRGIKGTVVPNSTRLDDNQQAGASAPLVIYDYTATSDQPVWNWFDKLTTYRVSGTSSWPIDDDPVSVLSGGLGTTFEYVGPGVPTRLKAHSSDNWDTTAVGRDTGRAVNPPRR